MSEFKKQIIKGVAATLGTLTIFIGAYLLLGMPSNKWIMYAVIVVFSVCFFGFLFYTFGGKKGFLSGAAIGFGFVAISVSVKELPIWISGFLLLAVLLFFVGRPLIKQYKKDKEKNSKKVIDKKIAKEIELEEAEINKMHEEMSEYSKSVRLGEKSLFLLAGLGGMYQIIKGEDGYYFIRVGGELRGIDESLVITDFDDEASLLKGKKDFFIPRNRIDWVKYKYRKSVSTPIDNCGKLKIKANNKRYKFTILDVLPKQLIAAFFYGITFNMKGKDQLNKAEHVLNKNEKRILPKLKKIFIFLIILSIIAFALFLFFPLNPITYRVLSTVCILIPVISFSLYLKYSTMLSMEDKKDSGTFKKNRVNITMPLLFPSAVLGLRSLLDFNIIEFKNLLIWSPVIIAVILFVFFRFTKEYKRYKSVIFVVVFVALYFVPSLLVQINCLYDFSEPCVMETRVLDKDISDRDYGSDYTLKVEIQNGKQKEFGVSREFYYSHNIGSEVTVVKKSGLLKIKFAYIDEK